VRGAVAGKRKKGSKHHIITDAKGIPLATKLTGANRHDVTQLLPLVDAIAPLSGERGCQRKRPKPVQGDHRQPQPRPQKMGLCRKLQRLKDIVDHGLSDTASL